MKLFRRKYHWSNSQNYEQDMLIDMFEFVKQYVESCAIRKRNKTFRHKFFEKFQSLFVLQYRWSNFTINFVTNLSTNKNWNEIKYDNIFVVIDRLTKMNHYVSIIKTIKVKNLTNVPIREIIRYHELFSSIIIDRDSLFTFEYYFFLCYVLKVKKKTFTTFHFQINEQTKRQNNIMKQYFRTYVNFAQNNWVFLFFMIEFAYNNANNVSIDMSSFKANLNYSFRMIFEEDFDFKFRIFVALNQSKTLRQIIVVLKNEFVEIQRNQTKFKNKRSIVRTYNRNDMIWLNVKNIKIKRNNKLKHRLFDLFKILDIHKFNVYKLTLFDQWHIHDVFHVFLLKKDNSRKK